MVATRALELARSSSTSPDIYGVRCHRGRQHRRAPGRVAQSLVLWDLPALPRQGMDGGLWPAPSSSRGQAGDFGAWCDPPVSAVVCRLVLALGVISRLFFQAQQKRLTEAKAISSPPGQVGGCAVRAAHCHANTRVGPGDFPQAAAQELFGQNKTGCAASPSGPERCPRLIRNSPNSMGSCSCRKTSSF